MQAGQQMYDSDGNQVCLFPMTFIDITQAWGPDTSSHCCGYPIDNALSGQTHVPVYAPFDCHLCYKDNSGNTRAYTSDKKVLTPKGLTYVTVSFTHDDNPPTQTSFKQGEEIAHTGTAGYALGDHCHIDQALIQNSQLINYGIICKDMKDYCWALKESTYPYDVFYINDTPAYHGGDMPWQTFQGGVTPVVTSNFIPLFLDARGINLIMYEYKKESD